MKRQFNKVYLVGFMGAGKTTIARLLAARMGWEVVEMDELIIQREGRPIPKIFASKGEPYFRSLESLVLTILMPRRQVVISTGGGTFVQDNNRGPMLSSGLVVWLDVPLEVIRKRLEGDDTRPLARDGAKMAALYAQRQPIYRLAHVRVDASLAAPKVVNSIRRAIS